MISKRRRAEPAMAIVLAALLLLASGLLALPLERGLRTRLSAYAASLRADFSSATGYDLSYDKLSPSVLSGLVISRLVVTDPQGRVALEARSASIRYDLFALLRGNEAPFLTGLSLRGARARLTEADLRRLERLMGGGGGADTLAIPRLLLDGRDLRLELPELAGGVYVDARRFRLDSDREEPSISLTGKATATLPMVGAIEADLGVSGYFARSLAAARLRLSLSATSKALALSRQDFDLSVGEGVVELRKARDAAPIDLYGRFGLESKDLQVNLRCEEFRPDSLFRPSGFLAFLGPWFRQSWTAGIEFRMPGLQPGAFVYDGTIAGNAPGEIGQGQWKLKMSAKGDLDRIEVREAVAEGERGRIAFSGVLGRKDLSLDCRLDLDTAFLEGRLPVRGSLRALGSSGSYRLSSERLTVKGLDFEGLGLGVEIKGETVGFELGFEAPAGEEPAPGPARGRHFKAEGTWTGGDPGLAECTLAFERLDGTTLEPLIALLFDGETTRYLSSLDASGEILLRSDFSHLSWSTGGIEVSSRLFPEAGATIAASGTDLDLRLRKATLRYRNLSADLSGEAGLAATGELGFNAQLLFLGVPYGFEGTFVGGAFHVSGDYGFTLSGRSTSAGTFASVTAGSFPLPLPGFPLAVSTDTSLWLTGPEDWSLAVARLEIQPSAQVEGTRLPALTLSGRFGPEGGPIARVRLSDSVSSVEGTGSILLGAGGTAPKVSMKLGASAGESYDFSASYDAQGLTAQLDFRDTPLLRFVTDRLFGVAEGRLRFSGPLDSLRSDYAVTLRNAKFDGLPLEFQLAGAFSPGGLGITDGRILWMGFEFSKLSGAYDQGLARGNLAGHFRSHTTLPGADCDFTAQAVSRKAPSPDWGAQLLDCAYSGSLGNFTYNAMTTPTWPFKLDISPRAVAIQGGPQTEFSLAILTDGSVTARAVPPFPVSLNLKGRIRGSKIEADASGLSIDMPILVAIVGQLPVTFKGGKLSGDLVLSGQAADPEFSGALFLSDCELSMPGWINETAGPISAPVVVDGKTMSLSAPSVPILKSRFSLDFGMEFDGWNPSGIHVRIRSLPDTEVPIETRILGVAIKGFAVPNLDLDVQGAILAVKGSLLLQKTDVVVTPETLAPGVESYEPPPSLLDIDLGINFSKNVRLYFPDRNYPVIAGNAEPTSRLSVRYDQSHEDLSVRGEVDLRGGDAFYIQRNFLLKSAKLVFNENSRKAFDPLVSMLAELRDSTVEGPITVTLRADNENISTFKPRLTSDPPKSESDIALLLGQGLFGVGESGQVDPRLLALSGLEFVPQLNATKAFESLVRDTVGLDVFYLNSLALQRWIYSLTSPSSLTAPTLGDLLGETSAYAGKYLSDTVFLHGSARLSVDPLAPLGKLGLDLRPQSEIGVDFETPFGLLQWSFQPQHPEQLFIVDQSLSLTWRLALK